MPSTIHHVLAMRTRQQKGAVRLRLRAMRRVNSNILTMGPRAMFLNFYFFFFERTGFLQPNHKESPISTSMSSWSRYFDNKHGLPPGFSVPEARIRSSPSARGTGQSERAQTSPAGLEGAARGSEIPCIHRPVSSGNAEFRFVFRNHKAAPYG